MRRRFNDMLINHCAELIKGGKTIIEISEIVGFNTNLISQKLRARGIDTSVGKKFARPDKTIQIDAQKVKTMYEQGISENQISKSFKVSRLVVRKHLISSGTHVRSQSEAEKVKWSQMSLRRRKQQVKSAHIATKGRLVSEDEKFFRARCLEASPIENNIGIGETAFKKFLIDKGVNFKYQAAVGPYNIDFLIGSVAVEITANNGRFFKNSRLHTRVKDLLKRDIKTLYVFVRNDDLILRFADDILTDIYHY
jgi:hypothetical protein